MSPSRPTRALAALAVLLLVLSSCQQEQRPSPAAWAIRWGEARAGLPDREAFSGTDDRARCDRALEELRGARERLLPAPDPDVERLATAWLDLAEGMMFECPLRSAPPTGFDAGYRELRRLAREVDLALATAGAGPEPRPGAPGGS